MKIMYPILNKMHLPQIIEFFGIKNATLHFILAHLFRELDFVRCTNIPFIVLVSRIWNLKEEECANFIDKDRFLKRFSAAYYDNYKSPRKPGTIKMVISDILIPNYISVVLTTMFKTKLKILTLYKCDLNDYLFSRFFYMDFDELIELNLNKNHLTNESIRMMTKMRFTNQFIRFQIDFNDLDEDALRIIFNSETFKHLVHLSIYLKHNRAEKEKVPYEDISKLPKLYDIRCNEEAFSYKVNFKTDQYNKFNKSK